MDPSLVLCLIALLFFPDANCISDYSTCDANPNLRCWANYDCGQRQGCFVAAGVPSTYKRMGCCETIVFTGVVSDWDTCDNDGKLYCFTNSDCEWNGVGGQCFSAPNTPVGPSTYGSGCCTRNTTSITELSCCPQMASDPYQHLRLFRLLNPSEEATLSRNLRC
ncbi:hypothetical protein PENTCL1PPCAC_189 [Pristionchus entomophagus]|uniref:Uncharacterized protein n=1 Tax=Pristionchus entomophagus TaxID=358040 RepID=A0AAV5SA86_9BILA|nr:hypothetical protein PENTCL1PPCAC_189 [Pristionchus entomophagus]